MKKLEEILGLYAEGWTKGDLTKILDALADQYQFKDPDKGSISKEDFPGYFTSYKESVGQSGDTFMDLEGVIAYPVGDKLVACCTWRTGVDKKIVGNGLIVVGEHGVEREDVVLL